MSLNSKESIGGGVNIIMERPRKALKVSTQALLRRRNVQNNELDVINGDIRQNHARQFNKQNKSMLRKRIVKTAYNTINRIIRRRFTSTSWICTQNTYEQFKTGDHDRIMLFSLHFTLETGVHAYIDGELEKNARFTLLLNRKDIRNNAEMIEFINFIFDNEKLSEERKYSMWTEDDLHIQLEHLRFIQHAIVNQVAFHVLQFGNYMNQHGEKWFNPRSLYEMINSLQE